MKNNKWYGVFLAGLMIGLLLWFLPEKTELSTSPVCVSTRSHRLDGNDPTGKGMFVLDTTWCSEANTGHGTDDYTWVTPGTEEEFYRKEYTSCGNITSEVCTPEGIVIGCSATVTRIENYDLSGETILSTSSSYQQVEEFFYLNGEKCTSK